MFCLDLTACRVNLYTPISWMLRSAFWPWLQTRGVSWARGVAILVEGVHLMSAITRFYAKLYFLFVVVAN
jgi:hypothetical protein